MKKWLSEHGFASKNALAASHERSNHKIAFHEIDIKEDIADYRNYLLRYSDAQRAKASELLIAYKAPQSIIEACSRDTPQDEDLDIISWLAHEPTTDEPYGATQKEIEDLLLWNADHTEWHCKNNEVLMNAAQDYHHAIIELVRADEIDAEWADAHANLQRIIVADILDPKFLDEERGNFDRPTKAITIWPYETDSTPPTDHVMAHELTHAYGGFRTKWFNEGMAERITALIKGDRVSHGYTQETWAIQHLIDGAQEVNDRSLSVCFLGNDIDENERQLRYYIQDTYGGLAVIEALDQLSSDLSSHILSADYTADRKYSIVVHSIRRAADAIAQLNVIRATQPQSFTDVARNTLRTIFPVQDAISQAIHREVSSLFSLV